VEFWSLLFSSAQIVLNVLETSRSPLLSGLHSSDLEGQFATPEAATPVHDPPTSPGELEDNNNTGEREREREGEGESHLKK